jgi:preprotein translocase subunit SecA
VDLSDGRQFLQEDWGLRSVCDWARLKYQIKLAPEELRDKNDGQIKATLRQHILATYRQKDVEFPVKVGMARFMAEQRVVVHGGQRYDREGLYHWAKQRFPGVSDSLSEEDFRTQTRGRLQERLLAVSRSFYPKVSTAEIDAKIAAAFEGTRLSEAEDARELAEWVSGELKLDVSEEALTGVSEEQARELIWKAFDARYRPEMRRMERGLLLGRLDASWKNHLYTMDHLRSGIGLVGYAQIDPKTEYKRQGMKEFEAMWEGVQDKVTESVFRMEEDEGFQESLWSIGATIHESAPRAMDASTIQGQQQAAISNSQKGDKKPEPIRNRGDRVGRNDPCPCGSGKKYKNCHMKQAG